MKYLKSFKLMERKQYSHGLYLKEDYVELLDKSWSEITIDKKTKTIKFDIDDPDSNYTYEVYYEGKGEVSQIMLQDAETFLKKLDSELSNQIDLKDVENLPSLPILNRNKNLNNFGI